ncbi:hypothetical protein VPH35_099624 [Triticum aestivum]|uniref:Uncharacterized protein n=1 Tax=Aegilops tauschii TaxID=37682 RepID=M8CIZ4_AEGTA
MAHHIHAQEDIDAEKLKTDVKKFLYDLRMHAEGTTEREGRPQMVDGKQSVVNEQKVNKFFYTVLMFNSTILRHSRMAAVVLVSLLLPPLNHPACFHMEYMDLIVENVPHILIVNDNPQV